MIECIKIMYILKQFSQVNQWKDLDEIQVELGNDQKEVHNSILNMISRIKLIRSS